MKKILLAVIVLIGVGAKAQKKLATATTASGEETTSHIFGSGYDADKKYIVFKLWNDKNTLTEKETTELDQLTKQLAKKNIEVVKIQWKTKEDLEELFKKYNIETVVSTEKGFELRSENHHYKTDASKVLFVFEDGKPLSLCSGVGCENNTKAFFKIIATN